MRPKTKLLRFITIALRLARIVAIPGHTLRVAGAPLPNSWQITPAGTMVPLTGDLPLGLQVLPDGRRVVVARGGFHDQGVEVVDIRTRKSIDSIQLGSVWSGLAVDRNSSEIFISGGGSPSKGLAGELEKSHVDHNVIEALKTSVLKLSIKNARLSFQTGLTISGVPREKQFIAGLAIGPENSLFALDFNNDTVYRLRQTDGGVIASARVGSRPVAVSISRDRRSLAIANEGDQSISILEPLSLKERSRVSVGAHPSDLAWGADGRLFVANAGSDDVSVIGNGKEVERIRTSLDQRDLLGATPNALVVSPDNRRLYVANADTNNVAVIDISHPGHSEVLGFIPTGWYPTSIAISRNGKELYVGIGKGIGSRPNVPVQGSNPNDEPDPKHKYDFIGDTLQGYLEIINVPNARELARYSQQVAENMPHPDRDSITEEEKSDALAAFSKIKHVLYIIRENRTYDQVFGDLGKGNGDPNLTFFGETTTPNAHQLARQTVTLDHLFANGEVSQDGQQWANAAYVTNFIQKIWPAGYSGRGEPDLDDRVSTSPAGYLWDNCRKHGLSYYSYGMFAAFTSNRAGPPQFRGKKGLEGHASEAWSAKSLTKDRDTGRAQVFLDDLKAAERTGEWPSFMVMHLSEDHTLGLSADAFTPTAMVANNDQALGQIVEAVSHSRFWPETAIFVIEDDAQDGPDHVDSHRTVGLVLSPYVKRGIVDSTIYTTVSMVRTIEMILGLPPMTQFDKNARPMYRSFTSRPELWAYSNIAPKVDLQARNPKKGPGAEASARLDFSDLDRADFQELNRILWAAFRPNAPMPAPVRSARVAAELLR